jgi:hypothetical protein
MNKANNLNLAIYVVGLCVMLLILFLGAQLDPLLRSMGMSAYLQEYRLAGVVKFFGFVFAFPIGLTICILAGADLKNLTLRYTLYVIALTAAISNLVLLWPEVVGKDYQPLYFGTGGVSMLVMISISGWLWSRLRASAKGARCFYHDLQGIGYFCFAMATWHSCGVGGLPGFAIYPDEVMQVKSYPFILGQLKVVMFFLILAWLATTISLYLRTKAKEEGV